MVDITPQLAQGKQLITGYGGGGFKINGQFIGSSLLLFPNLVLPWPVTAFSQIDLASLQAVLDKAGDVELLLVGTGNAMQLLDPAIKAAFKAKHIALDVMDTGAACRTYNVLMSEERKVAAALLSV